MAIDVVYTLAAVVPDVLIPFKSELVESLNNLRFDKYKQVREACLEAYTTVKAIGGNFEDKSKSPSHGTTTARIQMQKHKEQFMKSHTLVSEAVEE